MGIRKKTATTRNQEPAGVQFGLNSSHVGNISAIGVGRLHQSGLFFRGEPVSCSALSRTAPLTWMITHP